MNHNYRWTRTALFDVLFVVLLFWCASSSALAWTPGKPLEIAFPRLGMWWPDPWEQSLEDIARYDYVLLSDDQEDFIAPIKALHPGIILLNSTNACELSYDWPDSDDYAEILKIPPEWFLTQVGSTLTRAVDATTTTFHVADVSVTDGSTTYALFVSGDTALLGDGFFSYEINTNGHGSLCLMWFDEYDNAGWERGYLGQPLGPAHRVAGIDLGPNQLAGGDFETQSDLDSWELWTEDGYAATLGRSSESPPSGSSAAQIDVIRAEGADWKVSFAFQPVVLAARKDYTLSFWARADRDRAISLWAQQGSAPWKTYFSVEDVSIGTTWKRYELSVVSSATDRRAQFIFGLGQAEGTVFIDDARLQAGSREVWRRDFSGGTALVNATARERRVELGATFRKILGSQVPKVNDGALVTQVTLPPRDGLILLRADTSSPKVDPHRGTIGTRFRLTGPGFGKKARVYVAYLDPKKGKRKRRYAGVLRGNTGIIEARWKKVPPPGTYDLFVQPRGRKAAPIAMGTFRIMAPAIDGTTPLGGAAGETVTLRGRFFTSQKPKVYLQNPNTSKQKRCRVRASAMDPVTGRSTLTFKVPSLEPGAYRLVLKTKTGEAMAAFAIRF